MCGIFRQEPLSALSTYSHELLARSCHVERYPQPELVDVHGVFCSRTADLSTACRCWRPCTVIRSDAKWIPRMWAWVTKSTSGRKHATIVSILRPWLMELNIAKDQNITRAKEARQGKGASSASDCTSYWCPRHWRHGADRYCTGVRNLFTVGTIRWAMQWSQRQVIWVYARVTAWHRLLASLSS